MAEVSSNARSTIPPVSAETSEGQRIAKLLTDLPTLQRLSKGEEGATLLGELSLLLQNYNRPASGNRAVRFRRDQVVRIQARGRVLEEVGVMRDISASGARVSFQRSASFDAVQHEELILKARLPSDPSQVVAITAHLVRLAASSEREVQLAFRFAENQTDERFPRLLQDIADRNQSNDVQ